MDAVIEAMCDNNDNHRRIIIHLDMDYFYAQVEEIRHPSLRLRPVGVQQKNIVVTCNYIARQHGVKKLMPIADAKRLCLDLILINGEDLTPYRQMSQKIHEQLLKYTPHVEKLGLDENFLDVTTLVEEELKKFTNCIDISPIQGHVYPANNIDLLHCNCGCGTRLTLGSKIAQEVRHDLYTNLGITCSAGISYNKLLAKLVGTQNKPNQQTILSSRFSKQFLQNLGDLNRITGIGAKTASALIKNNIKSILELQCSDINTLWKIFGYESAIKLKNLSFGYDSSAVKYNGKPKSISLEDACKPISVYFDIENRFRILLMRLMERVAEDGRIPIGIKIILRKYHAQKKSSQRETKQANILPSLFKTTICPNSGKTKLTLVDNGDKLLTVIMRLFQRVVDLNQPFNISLIGLSFSKFQETKFGYTSIANFLIKQTDLEVQSITSLTNIDVDSNTEINLNSIQPTNAYCEVPQNYSNNLQQSSPIFRRLSAAASPIPILNDNEFVSGDTAFSDSSETEFEPLSKKSRLLVPENNYVFNTNRVNENSLDNISPSKLRVRDLNLNSRDSENEACVNLFSNNGIIFSKQLPNEEIELRNIDAFSSISYQQTRSIDTNHSKLYTQSSMQYKNSISSIISGTFRDENISVSIDDIVSDRFESTICPASVDLKVFKELPNDLQNELLASWRNSLTAAISNSSKSKIAITSEISNYNNLKQKASVSSVNAPINNQPAKNTLYRYFLSNK